MAADFVCSADNAAIIYAASSSSAGVDDSFEDACSICLEPFNTHDPATITNCKHEYHLQCILEWSQRSKECPICWRILVLKDPTSQELLAAAESERSSRPRHSVQHIHQDPEIDHDALYTDDSDFDERIMRHFAAVASRARYFNRRQRQTYSRIAPSQVLPSVPVADVPHAQMYTSPEGCPCSGYGQVEFNSPASSSPSTIIDQTSVVPYVVTVVPNDYDNRDAPAEPSQLPRDSPRRTSSSDLLAFSESFKSRLSTASARYKESISKSTRCFKEKLLARNNSVKELSKEVQREMNAGIAGVQKMIERLDLTSKRAGVSVPSSNCTEENSNFSQKGKGVQENVVAQSLHGNSGETMHNMSSDLPQHVSSTIPGRMEVSLVQGGN